jgi:hypothetical protein
LSFTLQLLHGRIGKLLDVVEREDTGLAPQRTLPPILVYRLQNSNNIALSELKLARLGGLEVEEGPDS